MRNNPRFPMINAPYSSMEERMALMRNARPDLLNQSQIDLADAQHECRTLNNSAVSCENLRNAISADAACQICRTLMEQRRDEEKARAQQPQPAEDVQPDLRPAA